MVDASGGVLLILALVYSIGDLACCQFVPLTLHPFFSFGGIKGNPLMDSVDFIWVGVKVFE
jgi:hypothetical protein